MGAHEYSVTARSVAAPAAVFEVLADATRWQEWAGAIGRSSYEREGDPAPHGVGAIRRFGARVGPPSREEVTAFDPPRRLSYRILSGLLPVRAYSADVTLEPDGGGTRITWAGRYRSWVPGLPAGLRRLMQGFADSLAAEADRRATPGDGGAEPV